MKDRWKVIVNPVAGGYKCRRDWTVIEEFLRSAEIPFDAVQTAEAMHAFYLARESVKEGYRKIMAVGGDGTLNELINAAFSFDDIASNEITFGMVPMGTGNDWGRMYNVPADYKQAVELISKEKTCLQDAGRVSYYEDSIPKKRFFINVAGMAFDSLVVEDTNRKKKAGKSSKISYLTSLFASLMKYRFVHAHINIDGDINIDSSVFSMNVGIGKFSGGGMMQVPEAIVDDGLFDLTVINKISKAEVIRNVKRLFNGTLLDHPKVFGYKGKKISIRSDDLIKIEVDGENIGHSPFEFEIFPRSVKVVCG